MKSITTILLLLFITACAMAQNVNISLTAPSDVGACIQNLYTINFTGAAAGTELHIVPSLNVAASGSCPTTDGVALEYVSASNATLVSDGDKLIVTVSSTAMTTVSYHALIDCHIAGSSSVNLTQTFTSNNGTNFLIGSSNIHTTPNIKKPSVVLQNTTDFKASYLSNSFFNFYYRNNGDSANIRFSFTPSPAGYCGQISTDSIFFQNGLNGTLYPYTGTAADTVRLAHLDTLLIKQRVQINSCLSSCTADTAKLSWQCNYTAPQANNFCTDCKPDKYSYHVSNNDSARADVIRISPAKADREFSCFNDTATGITWKYIIVNTGRGAMDSLNFELLEYGTSGNAALINYLMLIDSASVSITKGITSGCTLTTNLTTRSQWLCQNLVPKALYRAYVNIKNFGERDTIYISFTTMRCSQENNAALLNKPKIYNWWQFNNLRAKEICGTAVNFSSATGLFGSFISGQMTGSSYDDINLKLQYFPSVSNLSVDNNGNGDSATFSIDFKGLARNGAVNIYQLLGCDTVQNHCDTLYGWLRATVFCDSNIRITRPWQDVYFIKTDSIGDTAFFNPKYYYTSDTIGYSICRRASYYFYFNLADSAMRSVLDSGKFVFKIQACCGSDLSPSPYSATFHLLPNPNNCFALNYTGAPFTSHLAPPGVTNYKGDIQWLPLSDKQKELFVLCPGCKSPGCISHSYRMQRAASSLGLQDSDNDGRADVPITQITDTSAWFAKYGQHINRNLSGFGDRTEDFLLANFVDGDNTSGGYNYAQLQQLGLRFNVLQLSRFIPMGLDTMNLVPDSLVFYIDDTSLTGGGCIDCGEFNSGSGYNTVLKLNVGANDISDFFIGSSVAYNEYRFAFTSFYDSVNNVYSGNLHDYPNLITYTSNSFTGFMPSQHYRLRVFYSVCGNFIGGGSTDADVYVKPSQIINRFFLSGKIHQTVSDLIPQQPNTVAELDSAGWTVDTNDVNNAIADTTFMNHYAFFCETTGAIHYFASTVPANGTLSLNTEGCRKLLRLNTTSNITGGKSIYDAYPYEYKTPLLMPVNFNVTVPFGYYVSAAWVRNTVNFPSGGSPFSLSDTVGIQLTDTVGNIVITAADLPPLHCFTQNNVQAGNDSLFFGDQYIARGIDLQLTPLPQMCIDTLVKPAMDSTCMISFNIQTPSCLQSGACSQVNIVRGNGNMDALGVNPDLTLSGITNSFALLNSDTICWRGIKIENQNTTQPALTQADNVYLALIDSGAPYLAHWHFKQGTQVNYPNGNVIGLTPALAKGASISGDLCARIISCPNDTLQRDVKLHYGWNCGSYPESPYDSTKICEFSTMQLTYKKAMTGFNTPGKTYETPYTLCDTVTVSAQFSSTELGYVYPDSVMLQNTDPALQIVSVNLITDSATAQLAPATQPMVWLIGSAVMSAAGFPQGGIYNGQTVTVQVTFVPTCTFAGDTTLPDIVIFAHDFCNEIMSANAHKMMNSTFRMSSVQSACTDCWQITKTADRDTAAAVTDLVTYTITVCNNSANTQTGVLADALPSGFVVTGSTLPPAVTLNSMECDTFTVSGYFTQTGSCFYNVASVTSPANTTWTDSVCVNVKPPCTDSTTFIIPHNTYSTTLNYRYDTLNIYIAGTLYVNDTLKFMRCMVLMDEKAQIVVQNGGYLDIDSSTVQGCLTMWRGITVEDLGELIIQEGSTIADGDTTILAHDKAKIKIYNAYFRNFVLGVYIPPKVGAFYNGTTLTVERALFEFTAFKQDYTGQNPHGSKSQCGVLLNDWIGTIGGGTQPYELNYFNNLHTGVVGIGSILTVKRSCFKNITYDTFYNEPYRGTAITNVKGNSQNTTSLKVMPEVYNYITVDSSYRGIYTDGSVLTASYIHILNVRTGVEEMNAPLLSTNTVSNCIITASHIGIKMATNPFARFMYVTNNDITINGAATSGLSLANYGIWMSEGNPATFVRYTADNNNITLNNALHAIYAGALNTAKIKYNVVKLHGNGSGISVFANQNSNISCNTVSGRYPAQTYQNKGINISHSTNNLMSCNNTDSTYFGNYFEGVCTGTRFRGTEMKRHFEGLRLYTNAVIDTQAHAGNLWVGPFSTGGYGANNLNNSLLVYLLQSALIIDVSNGYPFVPTIPSNNTGWVIPDAGNEFDCTGYVLCTDETHERNAATKLQLAIAKDSLETTEFTDESKIMAKNYLYKDLKENDSLVNSNFSLAAFLAANESTVTGQLYEISKTMKEANSISETEMQNLTALNNLTDSIIQSINSLDSMAYADSTLNNIDQREVLMQQLNLVLQDKVSLLNQINSDKAQALSNVQTANSSIITNNAPDEYEQIMNDVEIEYETGGMVALQNRYSQVLDIAIQCPHVGGKAVYKARSYVAMLNDTIEYDDATACAQAGFRKATETGKAKEEIKRNIRIVPNPASEKITVTLSDDMSGICEILFYDIVGKLVLSRELDCTQKVHTLNIKNLSEGIYTIKIKQSVNVSEQYKLIIAR